MIPYACDTRSVCTGPAPFDADVAPCCDEHEEEWTRRKAQEACGWRGPVTDHLRYPLFARMVANHAGVAASDFMLFLQGAASLTHPARLRIREALG